MIHQLRFKTQTGPTKPGSRHAVGSVQTLILVLKRAYNHFITISRWYVYEKSYYLLQGIIRVDHSYMRFKMNHYSLSLNLSGLSNTFVTSFVLLPVIILSHCRRRFPATMLFFPILSPFLLTPFPDLFPGC